MRYIVKRVKQKFQGQILVLYYIYDSKERVTVSSNSPIKDEVERICKLWNGNNEKKLG